MNSLLLLLAAAAVASPASHRRPGIANYKLCMAKVLINADAGGTTPEELSGLLGRACRDEHDQFRTDYRTYLSALPNHPDDATLDEDVQQEIQYFLGEALAAYFEHYQSGTWPKGWP